MRSRTLLLAVILIGTAAIAPAVEIEVKPAATEFDKQPFLVPLVAPSARSAAVGDGWAAVGQVIDKAPQVSLFKLDAAGKPSGAPVVLKIPRPAAAPERLIYPQSLVFHPKLPLLYVWLDADVVPVPPYPDETHPLHRELDRLHVITLDGPAPALAFSLARGPGHMIGMHCGAIAYDPFGNRLYVPNVRQGMKQEVTAGIGWFHLGPDGLPLASDDEPAAKEVASAAPAQAAADRPARIAALRALLAGGKPIGAYRVTTSKTYGLDGYPAGAGIVPISRDVVVTSGYAGIVTWNMTDRTSRACTFLLPFSQAYYVTRLVGHPSLPVVYCAMAGRGELYRIELADGVPTLAPQLATHETFGFQGCPVVLSRRKMLAVCSTAPAIYLFPLDDQGRLVANGVLQVSVHGPASGGTHAIAASDKHDLLYVGVEKLK